jgi:hypothetical protein
MFLEVVPGIAILEIRHYNEWFLIQYICTKEFYEASAKGKYQ